MKELETQFPAIPLMAQRNHMTTPQGTQIMVERFGDEWYVEALKCKDVHEAVDRIMQHWPREASLLDLMLG